MMRSVRIAVALAVLFCAPASALTLEIPGTSTIEADSLTPSDSYDLPIGPASNGGLPVKPVEGSVTRQAWRIAGDRTTRQILAPLREQIEAAGFEILLDCQTEACGGFDFRFATEVLPPPEMYVSLGNYRFLSALRDTQAGPEALSVLVSRDDLAGHAQLIRVTPTAAASPPPPETTPVPTEPANDLGATLERLGRAVLTKLDFETGAARLGPGPHPSLDALVAWLKADPARRIALVGHTDMDGPLDANIALSKRRAEAVRARLIETYGVATDRLRAEGMGWLSPIESNATAGGRKANRRVEALVLTNGG